MPAKSFSIACGTSELVRLGRALQTTWASVILLSPRTSSSSEWRDLTLPLQAPASVSRVYYDAFERLVGDFNSAAPQGVKSGSQTAYVAWTWMRIQNLSGEHVSGYIYLFCMAFILCVSTEIS